MTRPLPLADVRILAVEQYGAGPFGSLLLADLGADVIKIEDPATAGDVGRRVPPYQEGNDNLFFESLNRNKRSVQLDLVSPGGRDVFHRLVRVADAVYFNLRGDVPAKLGLTYEQLGAVNPAIVCCSLSAYGLDGAMRATPGYDYAIQGLTGWMTLTGEPDGPPAKTGLSLVDFSTGMAAALALTAGVHAARRDGQGMDCDIALYDVGLSLLSYLGTWHLTAGYQPERTQSSAHPSLVPFQTFATADGWIVVACAKEKFWSRLCEALDRQDLAADPRFATFADRAAHRAALLPILDAHLRRQTTEHWLTELRARGVPCAPVLSVAEALAHPMASERTMVSRYPHDRWGTVVTLASPMKLAGGTAVPTRAPGLGEHTDRVMEELLAMGPEERSALRRSGVFGEPLPADPGLCRGSPAAAPPPTEG